MSNEQREKRARQRALDEKRKRARRAGDKPGGVPLAAREQQAKRGRDRGTAGGSKRSHQQSSVTWRQKLKP